MDYNHATITQIFGPISHDLVGAVEHVLRGVSDFDLVGQRAKSYVLGVYSDGSIGLYGSRETGITDNDLDSLQVNFLACTAEEARTFCINGEKVKVLPRLMSMSINLHMLADKAQKYFLYQVNFAQDVSQLVSAGDSFDSPLVNGYIGITKRNPLVRFREHRRDALSGTGHLFHKTWNALLRRDPTIAAHFMILAKFKTLDEVYEAEEYFVERHTLAPKGLNAIPGGMAGIKMMHQLRLLNGTRQISVEDRDAALVRLEGAHDRNSPCAHYRTGHFRTLPTGKMTWVSPCWVNPNRTAA